MEEEINPINLGRFAIWFFSPRIEFSEILIHRFANLNCLLLLSLILYLLLLSLLLEHEFLIRINEEEWKNQN